jgi:pimeloyl-ACP methyl ester carboxylesterase
MDTISSSRNTVGQARSRQLKSGFAFWTKRVLLGLLVLIAGMAALGAGYESIMAAGDATRYPPPGRLVDVGGYQLHIQCKGTSSTGTPTVILEAGGGSTSLDWSLIQPQLATRLRVCSYDRAGHGWSEPGSEPRSPHRDAAELHTLLANAGIPGPYVLVGHSYGGLVARLYAQQHTADVAGMVLIDSMHEMAYADAAFRQGRQRDEQMEAINSFLDRLGMCRLFGASITVQMFPSATQFPPQTRQLMCMFGLGPKRAGPTASESMATDQTYAGLSAPGVLDDMPLAVLAGEQMTTIAPFWQAAQQHLAALSTNSSYTIVEGGEHYLHWQYPALTIQTIRQVVEASRTGQPLAR